MRNINHKFNNSNITASIVEFTRSCGYSISCGKSREISSQREPIFLFRPGNRCVEKRGWLLLKGCSTSIHIINMKVNNVANNEIFEVASASSSYVAELNSEINARLGVPARFQVLSVNGKHVSNSSTVRASALFIFASFFFALIFFTSF